MTYAEEKLTRERERERDDLSCFRGLEEKGGRKAACSLETTKWKNNLQKWNSVDVDVGIGGYGGVCARTHPLPPPPRTHKAGK